MSLPKDYRVRLTKGDIYSLVVLYVNSDGDPIDITGKTIVWDIWLDEVSQLQLTSGSGLTVSAPSGQVVIELSALQTGALSTTKEYRHTLRDSTDETTLLQGYLDVYNPINP